MEIEREREKSSTLPHSQIPSTLPSFHPFSDPSAFPLATYPFFIKVCALSSPSSFLSCVE